MSWPAVRATASHARHRRDAVATSARAGMLTGKYGLTPGDGVAPAAVDDGDRGRAKKYAEAPRGRMDTRGWGLTLGRYRTTAMRSAAAQYARLAKEYGLKGGPARRLTQR